MRENTNLPTILPNNPQHAQIQPPQTKTPFPEMPIRRLEIRASRFALRLDVPAPAALVGDQRQAQTFRDAGDEIPVRGDGAQPVADAEVAALQVLQRVFDAGRGGGEEDVGFADGEGGGGGAVCVFHGFQWVVSVWFMGFTGSLIFPFFEMMCIRRGVKFCCVVDGGFAGLLFGSGPFVWCWTLRPFTTPQY